MLITKKNWSKSCVSSNWGTRFVEKWLNAPDGGQETQYGFYHYDYYYCYYSHEKYLSSLGKENKTKWFLLMKLLEATTRSFGSRVENIASN